MHIFLEVIEDADMEEEQSPEWCCSYQYGRSYSMGPLRVVDDDSAA